MAHLPKYGFKDPEKARQELLLLSAGPADRPYPFHVRQQFAAITPTLLEALGACGDPDGTLVRLERILTNLQAPGAIYDTLKYNPALCQYLVTLVSNSPYLSEILIRDPGLFDVFSSRDALNTPHSREDLEEDLANLGRAYDAEAAPYRLRDGETLRIGIRELFCGATVVEVGRELTQLAEVCLAHAVQKASADVARRCGEAQGAFAILGLGRLGGREMGYGSDLDLVFVYEAGAAVDSGMAPSEYFAAIAAHAMRRLKEPTRYGFLYDIDARLRPDGNKGALAVNHRRIEDYYREEARPWERLALIKARAVAGDPAFGHTVEERLREVAFALPVTPETLAQIEDIRARIVQSASPLDLKKDEGGLAEIEFTVRLMQVRHAPRFPELKRGDVLGTLEVLARDRAVPLEHVQALQDAYLLFRRIENRIRLIHGRSESALPEDPAAQAELAGRLGIEGDIAGLVHEHKMKVHALYHNMVSEA
jgi:glutamate-ammonia-ligase adenylyltransferase